MDENTENTVVVRTYMNGFEAELAKGILEEEGIECFISSDNAGWMEPPLQFIQGIKLCVLETDEKRARKVLDDYDSFKPEENK